MFLRRPKNKNPQKKKPPRRKYRSGFSLREGGLFHRARGLFHLARALFHFVRGERDEIVDHALGRVGMNLFELARQRKGANPVDARPEQL